MRYIELVVGDIKNRGQIEDHNYIPLILDVPTYRSYYEFDEEIKEHVQKTKSIKGFGGKYYLSRILFDIDKGEMDNAQCLDKCKELVEKLRGEFGVEERFIQPYFSGRGYHVTIPDIFGFKPGNSLPITVRLTLKKHFPETDHIYDASRIIRMENTINEKSGLYKIPLSVEELFNSSAVDILTRASSPRSEYPIRALSDKDRDSVITMGEWIVHSAEREGSTGSFEVSNVVTCTQHMFNEGPKEGSRHKIMLRMASAWRRAGVPREGIISSLISWAVTVNPDEIVKLVDSVFKNVYEYSCNDEVMSKFCDSRCIFYKKKNYGSGVVSAGSMEEEFARFAKTDFSETSFDLSEMYRVPEYRFYPGEMVLVIGDTKLGKTAWVQDLCVKLPEFKIIYFSLEVHQNLCYRRFIQIAHEMTKKEVFDHYSASKSELWQPIKHIMVCTDAPDLLSIKRIVGEYSPSMIVIDTTDCIVTPGKREELAEENAVARGLKEVAQSQDIIVIGVHHISKEASKAGRLTIHSGKGTSSFKQKDDKIISIEGSTSNNKRTIRSLGARDEASFQMVTEIDWNTFKFKQLNEEPGGLLLK